MFDLIVDKAVELFAQQEFDVDGGVFEATDAWASALEQLVQTDQDALALLNEILADEKLRSRVKYWHSEDGEKDFVEFIRDVLHSYGDDVTFDELVAARIEDYHAVVADRERRAPANA